MRPFQRGVMTDRQMDALIDKILRDMRRRETAAFQIERKKYERKRRLKNKAQAA
jgi:hypothetical protein